MAKVKKKLKEKVSKTKSETKKNAKGKEVSKPKTLAAFYAKNLEKVEKDLGLVANSVIEPERISSGVLCVDYVFGSGLTPGVVSIAGEEQSAKTSLCYHALAQAKQLELPFCGFYDAEGAISPKYTKSIWEPFGLDLEYLMSKKGREEGFYYYRDQVIEKMFDYLKRALKLMPDKNWVSEANSWCYFFPKRDDHAKKLMEVMGVKPVKSLSDGAYYVSPTEIRGPQGIFVTDSFASMLTREEEDKEDSTKGTRSAMDAAAFSVHLKRVKVDLSEKKVLLLGTNHLGSHVRKVYGGPDDQQYEKMGNSLKYYCLHPDEYVLTENGILSIREVDDIHRQSPDRFPIVGTLKGTEKSEFFGFVGKKPTIVAITNNGRMIHGGKDHRVLAIKKYELAPKWVKLRDLTPSHYIPTKLGNNLFPKDYATISYKPIKLKGLFNNSSDSLTDMIIPEILDEKLAELLGVIVADGHVRSQGLISITKVDLAKRLKIKQLVESVLGITLNETKIGLTISSQTLAGLLAYLGVADKKTGDKEIPLLIRQSPKSVQLAFMKGFMSCDCSTVDGRLKIHSSSKYIVRQMSIMLLNMGIYNITDDKFYTHERSLNVTSGVIQGSMATLVIPNKDMVNLLTMMGGMADYARIDSDSTINRSGIRDRWYNPSDVMPNIWGWDTKFINEILGKVSKYARKKGIHLGKSNSGIMYWEELKDDIVKDEYRDNSTGFNTKKRRAALRELYRLKKFTKNNNLVWEKVDSLKVFNAPSLTYDFSVPGSRTVVAGGIVGHNSDARARTYSRAAGAISKFGRFDYDKDNSKFGIEPSVEGKGTDRYAIKEIKNTKNKYGNPGLKSHFRVWVSDMDGKPRGVDPAFDVFRFLQLTDQIKKGEKQGTYKFNLKESVGKKRSNRLNSLKSFTFLALKSLVVAEYTNNNNLLRKSINEMGIDFKPKLRESLFSQLKNDETLYSSIKSSAKTEDEEMEDDDDVDYEQL